MEAHHTTDKHELKIIEQSSRLLDTAFRVPGTQFRIGLDPIIGLFPVAGNLVTFGMSALLVWTMVRHGASGRLVFRMLANVVADAAIGAVPILGNLADFGFKANQRNMRLLREYHYEGKHRGNGWLLWLAVGGLLVVWIAGTIWLVGKVFNWMGTQWAGF